VLVVRPDDLGGPRKVADVADDAETDLRMLVHGGLLLRRKRAGLCSTGVGYADLADVVEQRAAVKVHEFLPRTSQAFR